MIWGRTCCEQMLDHIRPRWRCTSVHEFWFLKKKNSVLLHGGTRHVHRVNFAYLSQTMQITWVSLSSRMMWKPICEWSMNHVLIFLCDCRFLRRWGFQCVHTCLKCWIKTACLPLIPLTRRHGQTLQCLTCQWHTTDCYWFAPLLLLAKFITGSTKVVWDGHRGWSF